jgi:hypothetical protein
MASIISWIQSNAAVILGLLFALSEALALIPGVDANSVFQLIYNWLKANQPPAAK